MCSGSRIARAASRSLDNKIRSAGGRGTLPRTQQRRVLLAELDAEMRANNQISVIDATHRDVERVAYSPLACIAGCGDVPAAKKLGSS